MSVDEQAYKVQEFLRFLSSHQEINRVINMDQTPVWLNIGSTGKTVDFRGDKQVSATIPNGNPHEKYSIILACTETGGKYPPAIIAKSNRKKLRVSLHNGILVFHNPKTSMANSDIMSKWVQVMLPKDGGNFKKLLILDSFRGHLTQQMKDVCEENDIVCTVIPGALTPKLQPLDISVNRSFKAYLREFYRQHGVK